MASKTFRSAANTYLDWEKRNENTKALMGFYPAKWRRFEQLLNNYALPVIGERTMPEICAILESDRTVLLPGLTGMEENERNDTEEAVFAVIRHHLYWEAESLEL
jgi:hypothetical protein